MTTPRCQLVDPENALFYHLVSRCVRRSWLCGYDRQTRRDYSHRKEWLVRRIKQLGAAFAVDVYTYAVMSNHFHLIVYHDPKAPLRWSDEEVADRWLQVCPPKLADGTIDEALREFERNQLLSDPSRIEAVRRKLGSVSTFMKLLKQPIARRANQEDGCTGHFFEQRFYSGALLGEETILAAMAYVDLNPIRAKIAKSIATAKHTSIYERLRTAPTSLDSYIQPIVAGTGTDASVKITLRAYIERLEVLTPSTAPTWTEDQLKRWRGQVFSLRKRQRVFGPESLIKVWIEERGWRMREDPLPIA